AGGHLEDPGAELDLGCLPGEPAEHGGGVGAVGLGGPDGVVSQPLGLLDDVELVGGAEAQAPVADVDAELHVQVSFQRKGIRCVPGAPVLGLAARRWRARAPAAGTDYAKSPP